MNFSEFGDDAGRCADDLNTGNAVDAAAVLRREMYGHPLEFNSFVDEVNRLSSMSRRDDIVRDTSGNVAVRDRYTGKEIVVGRPGGLPPTLPPIDIGGHL